MNERHLYLRMLLITKSSRYTEEIQNKQIREKEFKVVLLPSDVSATECRRHRSSMMLAYSFGDPRGLISGFTEVIL